MAPFLDPRSALLQALVESDSYGLELIERVRKRTDGKLKIPQGSVYPALRDLEADGLVESYDGETAEARMGRPRRYYKLTAEGLRAAREDANTMYGLFKFALGTRRA
jgi:PadR family transcriptional regulator PadR